MCGLPGHTYNECLVFFRKPGVTESLWTKMIVDYKLENNKYFNKMWKIRERFIPIYFKNNFYPFLQSTTRSESTNARIKRNVGPTYNITSFLTEY
jgi:hypothetical protein